MECAPASSHTSLIGRVPRVSSRCLYGERRSSLFPTPGEKVNTRGEKVLKNYGGQTSSLHHSVFRTRGEPREGEEKDGERKGTREEHREERGMRDEWGGRKERREGNT